MIAALAGRRIDVPETEEKRFPLEMADVVYERILDFFEKHRVEVLVSSAACGADLLAQKAARALEIKSHVILPFGREKFRETSVTDRPGDWGELFDEICERAERQGNLIILEGFETDEKNAYSAVTNEILNRTESLKSAAVDRQILAVVVWDGKAKGERDETALFIEKAKMKNIATEEILTK
jgi:hypothetical protein